MKRLLDGLLFGAGFAVSFLLIWAVAGYWIASHFSPSRFAEQHGRSSAPLAGPYEIPHPEGATRPFHELGVDEQIKQSTVIALARYEPGPDGKRKAVIREFLKKDPGTTVYYKVGDEFSDASYYPKDNTDHGDGVVIFFTGSPAEMAESMTYSGDRITGLGDIPVELFRAKCQKPRA
jgi:hypothetical protein